MAFIIGAKMCPWTRCSIFVVGPRWGSTAHMPPRRALINLIRFSSGSGNPRLPSREEDRSLRRRCRQRIAVQHFALFTKLTHGSADRRLSPISRRCLAGRASALWGPGPLGTEPGGDGRRLLTRRPCSALRPANCSLFATSPRSCRFTAPTPANTERARRSNLALGS
jgi:hypothetical protein